MFFKWKITETWLLNYFCFGKNIHGKIRKKFRHKSFYILYANGIALGCTDGWDTKFQMLGLIFTVICWGIYHFINIWKGCFLTLYPLEGCCQIEYWLHNQIIKGMLIDSVLSWKDLSGKFVLGDYHRNYQKIFQKNYHMIKYLENEVC